MPSLSAYDVFKPQVRDLSAYTLEYFQADVKLDQNENPYEFPAELKQRIVDRLLARPWGRYPELVPEAATQALAKLTGWNEEGILLGNGSNELIQSTLNVTVGPGVRVALVEPSFAMYRMMATVLGARLDPVLLEAQDLSFGVDKIVRASRRSDVLVLCSPNNPTGTWIEKQDLIRVLESARGLVLLDEAYHEFSGQTFLPLLGEFDNLVIVRTFSKAMSMAGLRFGYMVAHPEVVRQIRKGKLPYSVNILALMAAEVVLDARHLLDGAIGKIVDERERLTEQLAGRPGVRVFPSRTNFVLIETPHPPREIFDALRRDGVLVRDVSGYPLLARALRVSVGRPDENDRFLGALDRALEMRS